MTRQEAENQEKAQLWAELSAAGLGRESALRLWNLEHNLRETDDYYVFLDGITEGFVKFSDSGVNKKAVRTAIENFTTRCIQRENESQKPCLNVKENPFAAVNHPQKKQSPEPERRPEPIRTYMDKKGVRRDIHTHEVWDFGASMDHH